MAYVEKHRGGRHLVESETGVDECSGWRAVCRLDEIPDGRGQPVMLKVFDRPLIVTVRSAIPGSVAMLTCGASTWRM